MPDRLKIGILIIIVGLDHQNTIFILRFGRNQNNFIHYGRNRSVRFPLGYYSLGFLLNGFLLCFSLPAPKGAHFHDITETKTITITLTMTITPALMAESVQFSLPGAQG